MPVLRSNEFSRNLPLSVRVLTFEEIKNFKKKISNSQILIFKIYKNNPHIYALLNTTINITITKEILNFFINNRKNYLSYLVFETNFFFEMFARIEIDSLSKWEEFQQIPSLNDYDLICYLIVYRNKIIKNFTLNNFKKIKDLRIIHDLFYKNLKNLDVFLFFGTSNTVRAVGRVSSLPEFYRVVNTRFFVELCKVDNFYKYYSKKINVSYFLFFKKQSFFFLKLSNVEYELSSNEHSVDADTVIFESNFFFEAAIYIARGVNKAAVRDELLLGFYFDKYILHSIVCIDPETNKMRIVEQFEYHKNYLNSTNFYLLLNKITSRDNLYLTLLKKKSF